MTNYLPAQFYHFLWKTKYRRTDALFLHSQQ